ncbi:MULTISPECIES: LemA family protein [Moraxella]|uniref:LemA family n=1 Tax=Moraxella lacunata TaxID=477 RepID=A0A1B8PXP0_MORLA|nr:MULTISPECIES: LemA family protein [Moraxella]MBE9578538.1 LemA family protein [Moraxella sp. K1664]MBE9587881.1 LemA family protein [Moraxella sp. K1630]MBE9590243.1 LemA family protein [Moraxella sp. K127]MBE9596057.1 LemA family protein [Moraxella sp. K2450]MDH9218351.1 LemA family protein [Moraxella lacunata]
MAIIVTLIILAVIIGFLIAVYNALVRLRNQVANGLAQIDVQLKRRHDLIPNLVNVAKRYMTHEEQVLTRVTEARNIAKSGLDALKNTGLSGTDGLAKLANAESNLSRALGSFYAVVENYPELKADSALKELSDEIKNTENRIGFARQFYNDSVMFYNNKRESFPNNLVANWFGFMPIAQLEFADKSAIDVAPAVSL